MNKKVKRIALRSALSSKFAQNKLIIVDNLKFIPTLRKEAAMKKQEEIKRKDFHYTATLVNKLEKHKLNLKNVLIVDVDKNEPLHLASRNLNWVQLTTHRKVNVYSILRMDNLMVHKDAIEHLRQRSTIGVRIEPPETKKITKKVKKVRKIRPDIAAIQAAANAQATSTM